MIDFVRAHSGLRPKVVVRVGVVLALVVLAIFLHDRSTDATSTRAAVSPPAPVSTRPSMGAIQAVASPSSPAVPSPPVRLKIASIAVQTSLQQLGLMPDGSLQSPSQWSVAGWYVGGVVPGQIGPAVIAGHVDSTHGAAVFYRLKELVPGATVAVDEQNGTLLTFVVDTVQSFPKNDFPTAVVYGPTPDAELRLITCTGDFDSAARSYRSNLVVTAHLVTA